MTKRSPIIDTLSLIANQGSKECVGVRNQGSEKWVGVRNQGSCRGMGGVTGLDGGEEPGVREMGGVNGMGGGEEPGVRGMWKMEEGNMEGGGATPHIYIVYHFNSLYHPMIWHHGLPYNMFFLLCTCFSASYKLFPMGREE